jgi:predicted PurR-regulated permease PerM
MADPQPPERDTDWRDRMPRWVPWAIALAWAGFIATLVLRWTFSRLSGFIIILVVSLFLALAIEPGVNHLAGRGWRRGVATALILLAVFVIAGVFVVAIGSLVVRQVADLLGNSEKYVNRTVTWLNDTFNTQIDPKDVNNSINDPHGFVQRFIDRQQSHALQLSVSVLGFLLQAFSVLLFTFYLVADGPRLRRAICSRLAPERQRRVLSGWELAITKTGSYLYSRALLAGLSASFHWVVFTAIGIPAPLALALWVGIISQFIPVVGTYIAGALPVLLALVDPGSTPLKALLVLIFIVIYQQIENYVFAPRITARTLDVHPAVAFGAALAGAALLGPVGAILALPGAAMFQAISSEWGVRHVVVDSPLTTVPPPKPKRRRQRDGDEMTEVEQVRHDAEQDAIAADSEGGEP